MHEIIVTFLRVMYGDDLLPNLPDIQKRYAVHQLHDITAILYPRRSGKTKTQTIAGGCIMVSQPKGNCSCYNIGGRQARDWLQEAYDVMNVFKHTAEFGWSLDKADAREFVQIKTAFGTINRISSYPGVFQGGANIGHSELRARAVHIPQGEGGDGCVWECVGMWHGQCMFFLLTDSFIQRVASHVSGI
jgi:hypothetical protein